VSKMTVMAGWGLLAEQMRRNAQIAIAQAEGGGYVEGSPSFRESMDRYFSSGENAYTAAADSLYKPVEEGGGYVTTLTYPDGTVKKIVHGTSTIDGNTLWQPQEEINGQLTGERYNYTLADLYAKGGAGIIAGGYVGEVNAYGQDPTVPTDWLVIAELLTIFGLGGLIVLKVIY